MDEAEVVKVVNSELDRAESFINNRISVERAAAYDYYYGREFGNEVDGRSRVVSSDVAQVVDSALPSLLKIFVSGDKAVEFSPRNAEDVEAAEQATVAANYVFFSQNNGYGLAHDFLKDGLLQKTGVFKWKWDTSVTMQEKKYTGLDTGTLEILSKSPGVEIIEHTEYPDEAAMQMLAMMPQQMSPGPQQPGQEQGPPQQPEVPMLHDVVVRVKKEAGRVKIIVPPPEEILVSPDAMSLDVMEMPFIAHTPMVTASDLREMGYEQSVIDELAKGDRDTLFSDEQIARKDRNESASSLLDDDSGDPSQQVYRYNECYIKIDVEGDGIAQLHKVCIVGTKLLNVEPVDHIPMAIWTPKVMPHEVIGVSLAEDAMDSQLLKSTIWRGINDSMYQSIAPRMFVTGDVNMDDVLTIKPGGVIRGEPNSTLTPVVVPFVGAQAFQLLEYIDQEEEAKTGVSRLFQGIDPQAINKTATGVNALVNQATARIELIARNAAEFGFKPLFKGIQYLLSKHQQQALIVRLTNSFVPVDPETWNKEYDMSVNVGLGTGTKEQMLMQLQALGMDLQAIGQSPFAQQLLDAKKVFNYVEKKAEFAGFKDVTVFLNDPEGTQPPPPPKPPEVQVAEIEAQTGMQRAQMEQQGKGQELMAKGQLEAQRMQQEAQLKEREMAMEAELERFKAELKAQTELQVAQIREQLQHEREMRRVDVEAQAASRPNATVEFKDTEGALKGASDHLRGHGEALNNGLAMMAQAMAELRDALSRPKTIVRGKDGRAVGVQ